MTAAFVVVRPSPCLHRRASPLRRSPNLWPLPHPSGFLTTTLSHSFTLLVPDSSSFQQKLWPREQEHACVCCIYTCFARLLRPRKQPTKSMYMNMSPCRSAHSLTKRTQTTAIVSNSAQN